MPSLCSILWTLTCASLLPTTAAALKPHLGNSPHIVFILADDFGWNDIGYHQVVGETTRHKVATPTLDRLAAEGVKLEAYYVQPLCSPSRAALLTGRYPSSNGIGPNVNGGTHGPSAPYGLPAKEVLLPEVLKLGGYESHMVGKWHLGHCHLGYTPTVRGFDSFTGFLNGAESYFVPSLVSDRNGSTQLTGHDMRAGGLPNVLPEAWPIPRSGPGAKDCYSKNSTACYSTIVYAEAAIGVIKTFASDLRQKQNRLFLYVAFQATHNPLTAPDVYASQYAHIEDYQRRLFAGMTAAMDEAVANITAALSYYGLWRETVFIFSTDNGGEPSRLGRSNNYPLRGGKVTNWEGGVRGVGFIRGTDSEAHAPLPKGERRGDNQLMHISDWFPTLVYLAGVDYTAKNGQRLDGMNQWKMLLFNDSSPRLSILHNVQPNDAIVAALPWDAIRLGPWKLHVRTGRAPPRVPPPGFSAKPGNRPRPFNGSFYLFHIPDDPYEQHNLAEVYPAVLARVLDFYQEAQSRTAGDLFVKWGGFDPAADPQLRRDKFWGPSNSSKALCRYGKEFE